MATQNPKTPQRSKTARLVDVAAVAGVSRWAAGHVLNGGKGNSRVSDETAKRIHQAAKILNYHPNHAASTLRGKRSRTLGLLVASAGDPLRSFLVQYLDVAAVENGCRSLICNTIGNPAVGPDQFQASIEELSRRQVDGVLCAVHPWWRGDRAELIHTHPNTVFYEDQGIPLAHTVLVDREYAIRQAVEHLAERGRQRIGLALAGTTKPTQKARIAGWRGAIAEHGLAVDDRLLFDGQPCGPAYAVCSETEHRWQFPAELMDRVIESLVDQAGADAIVAHDDFWAAALIKRMRARGIVVPRDVAVVGYLNHYLADWIDPALTTIDLNHTQAARVMVEMLERIITHGPLPTSERVVKVKPKLIVREST